MKYLRAIYKSRINPKEKPCNAWLTDMQCSAPQLHRTPKSLLEKSRNKPYGLPVKPEIIVADIHAATTFETGAPSRVKTTKTKGTR